MIRWGVPGLIRLVTPGGEEITESGQNIPPQAPSIISAVPEATFSASINLTGAAPHESRVRLIVNNDNKGEVNVDDDGRFTFDNVSLGEGENELRLVTIDDKDEMSNPTTIKITRDDIPPNVEIVSPGEDVEVFGRENETVSIEGNVDEEGISVWVNEHVVVNISGGSFKYRTQLQEGMNEFSIRVVDRAGNVANKLVRVNYAL